MGLHGPLLSKSEWSLGIVSDMVRAKDARLPTNKQIKLLHQEIFRRKRVPILWTLMILS